MLRRFDTLFVRLFLLMWATLVASHLIAFVSVVPSEPGTLLPEHLPTLPSLPPGNPFGEPEPPAPEPPGLPRELLWLDYGLRALVIAAGAALGARWLSAPMRRLARAADALGARLGRGGTPEPLDDARGTREVRDTARVFNQMATRLQEQFDARSLQMAALSHDLRTPLTRLRMRLEPLPEARAALADLREMDEMVDATLAVLREQRDGQPARPVDVGALLQALVDDLAALGHRATLDGMPAPLRARARPAALRRIVGNLVGNALRYGGAARVALRPGTDGTVEVWVDDDGPGIPPEQLARAFEPWVRLDDAGHPRAGHGLGLAIARELAERDGATLVLDNRPEGGLRARLRLPPA